MSALLIIRSQILQLFTFSTFYPFYEGIFPRGILNHDNIKVSELQIWYNDDINIISNIIYDM